MQLKYISLRISARTVPSFNSDSFEHFLSISKVFTLFNKNQSDSSANKPSKQFHPPYQKGTKIKNKGKKF